EHVVELGRHSVELPVGNVGFDVEEDPSVPLRVQVPVDAVHVQIPNGNPVDHAKVTRGDVDRAQVLTPVRVFVQPETRAKPGVQVGDLQAGNGDVFLVVQREHVLHLTRAVEAGAVS